MSGKKKIDTTLQDVSLQYSNWFSQLVNLLQTTFLYIIGGRGTSKSEDILAQRTIDMCYDMPGALIALSSDTYMNSTKNILPSILNGWNRKGWLEDTHYVVNKPPPKHFKKPYKPVLNWQHTVATHTGVVFKVISQDRPSIGAGDSYQHQVGDEAKYLNKQKLDKTGYAVRGEFVRFGKSPFYGGATFTTDMPNVNHGEHDWILEMADNMDKDKIRNLVMLARTVNEVRAEYVAAKHDAEAKPADLGLKRKSESALKKMARWDERFRLFRMDTTFFYAVTSFVNVDILTAGYFKKLLETMDFKQFMVSVLSISPKLEKGLMFYPNLENKNFFSDGFTYGRRDKFGLNDEYEETSLDLKHCWHDAVLEGGIDSGNMCSLIIGQEQGRYARILKEFYTLPSDYLPELGNQFVQFFRYHKTKELLLWHDRAMNAYQSVGEDQASKIKKAIEFDSDGVATGWSVTLQNRQQKTIYHQDEYELQLQMMAGKNKDLPMLIIDQHNCPCLKSSLELTEKIIRVKDNGNKTIHKDKSSEKLPPEQLPKKSTNMSDALKYFICRPAYLEKIRGTTRKMSGTPGLY